MPRMASRSASARLARGASNILLGMAIGLLSYYGMTSLVTGAEQARLVERSPRSFFVDDPLPPKGPALDFLGWEDEDEAYWDGLEDGEPFARIVSEEMDLDAVVVKGVARSDLMKGPGWITYTDLPGPTGNCGISGHRTTYGAPFRHLDRLRKGDTIQLFSSYRRYTYRVRKVFSVTPDRVDVVDTTEKPTLTLTACHPPYSARLRLIAQADLIEVRRSTK